MATKKEIDWSPGNWPYLFYRFITSYRLAAVVLVFMTLITLFGTLYQVDNGLHAAKQKYFNSLFVVHDLFGKIPIPLPGGMLLMIILFVNMLMGAIVKVKKRLRGIGLLISHIGMLLLLAGGFVTWAFATDGYMALYPGMTTSKVESYRRWQMEVLPVSDDGKAEKAWVIPPAKLEELSPNEQKTFEIADLPFDVRINSYARNAIPMPTSAPMSANVDAKEIDGFKLAPQQISKEAEQNVPGAYVEFVPRNGDEPVEAILWGGSYKFDPKEKPMPFQFRIGEKRYAAQLAKKTWTVPFQVRLDEFILERHPGVSTARNYESRITRMEGDKPEEPIEIKMNEPMRYGGYTFFQESFGPANGRPGELYSQFAVANNPADQWPLIALSITWAGLLVHFIVKLGEFIIRSTKQRSNTKPAEA